MSRPNNPHTTTTKMLIPQPPTSTLSGVPAPSLGSQSLSRERLIAELAVQRASLVTKRVLSTLDLPPSSPIPSTPISPLGGGSKTFPFFWSEQQQQQQQQQYGFPHPQQATANNGRRCSIAKPDASPVTIADFAAQALLISAIHSAFPQDAFVGEEDSASLRADPDLARQVWDLVSTTFLDEDPESERLLARPRSMEEMFEVIDLGGSGSGSGSGGLRSEGGPGTVAGVSTTRFWALDPIDGTSAFLKGQQYAVSLALIENGKEVLGVLGCPNLPVEVTVDGRMEEGRVSAPVEPGSAENGNGNMGVMLSAVKGDGFATVREMGRGGLKPAKKIDRRRPGTGSNNNNNNSGDESGPVKLRDLHFVDSSLSAATSSSKVRELADMAGARYPGTEIYSSHMRYAAMVLGGRAHVQVRVPHNKRAAWCLWDHAGSQLIYTESGAGKVTDLHGREIDFGTGRKLSRNWGLITADESVHAEVQALVNELLSKDTKQLPN